MHALTNLQLNNECLCCCSYKFKYYKFMHAVKNIQSVYKYLHMDKKNLKQTVNGIELIQ
jgi:hypothetical protein